MESSDEIKKLRSDVDHLKIEHDIGFELISTKVASLELTTDALKGDAKLVKYNAAELEHRVNQVESRLNKHQKWVDDGFAFFGLITVVSFLVALVFRSKK